MGTCIVTRPSTYRCLLVALMAMCNTGCGGSSGEADVVTNVPQGQVVFVAATPVPLVPGLRTLDQQDLQLLIDGSASMTGTADLQRVLTGLVARTVNLAHKTDFEVRSRQTCVFSAKLASEGRLCLSGIVASSWAPSGYTNLDQAVASFSDAGLSILLTDGVPARLPGAASAGCAGVDTGCVAAALAKSVSPKPGQSQESVAGLFLVPVMFLHQGRFLTERVLAPQDYDSAIALHHVANDTATTASVEGVAIGSDKTMLFNYKGPRTVYLLIHSENRSVGQSFLARLYEQATHEPVQLIGNAASYQRDIALLQPIELFPGLPPSLTASACSVTPNDKSSTFGACSINDQDISLKCTKHENRGTVRISRHSRDSGVTLHEIVPIDRSVTAAAPSDINGTPWTDMQFPVTCNASNPSPCNAASPHAKLDARPAYERFAEFVEKDNYLGSLDTDDLSVSPHRILGLKHLLRNFFDRTKGIEKRPQVSESFRVCVQ